MLYIYSIFNSNMSLVCSMHQRFHAQLFQIQLLFIPSSVFKPKPLNFFSHQVFSLKERITAYKIRMTFRSVEIVNNV